MYEEKKTFALKLIIIVFFLIIFVFCFVRIRFQYYSTDSKDDIEVVNYLKKYMKEEYDIDCDLTLISKKLMEFKDFCIDGSCAINYKNNGVYHYEFDGVDSNNSHFSISYSNSYTFRLKKYDSIISENYYINYNKDEIEKLVKNDFNDYKIYFSTENKHYHIIIYDKNFSINKLISLKNNIFNLFYEKFSSYSLIVVGDNNLYEELQSSNYKYKYSTGWTISGEGQVLSNDYKLVYDKEIKSDDDLLSLNLNNDNYVVVLLGYGIGNNMDENIYLYNKQNNNINRNW